MTSTDAAAAQENGNPREGLTNQRCRPGRRNKILIVDDDSAIRATVAQQLASRDYDIATAIDGEDGFDRFRVEPPELVLTDLAMPRLDGFELIRRIRSGSAVPILVLSVRGADTDKVRALDLGADDFVVKPFSMAELLARVRAQLRRPQAASPKPTLEFPELVIDIDRRVVTQGGRDVRLTPTEFAILELLARNAGRPITFDDLIATVWKGAPGTTNDAVRFHVGSLRRKLEPQPATPRYLVTEPWVGYRFMAEPLGA
ncbi:MAG: response regulator transcription factor [Acidobacteria bacterium]|nr:response regulator transcription factor [Acidobacteriota bacterium]